MRLLFIFIELLPLAFIVFVAWSIYRFFTKKPSYKKFTEYFRQKMENRYEASPDNFIEHWSLTLRVFEGVVPRQTISQLKSMTPSIEAVAKKFSSNKNAALNPDVYLIKDIIYKHVPELLESFAQIPPGIAYTKHNSNGKTAAELVNQNSFMLVQSFNNIINHVFEDNLHDMKVQQVFIKDKFKQYLKDMQDLSQK